MPLWKEQMEGAIAFLQEICVVCMSYQELHVWCTSVSVRLKYIKNVVLHRCCVTAVGLGLVMRVRVHVM